MAITKTVVTGTLNFPDDSATITNGRIEFRLSSWSRENSEIIVPGPVSAPVATNGTFSVELWADTVSARPVEYVPTVYYYSPAANREVSVTLHTVHVPASGPVTLASLLASTAELAAGPTFEALVAAEVEPYLAEFDTAISDRLVETYGLAAGDRDFYTSTEVVEPPLVITNEAGNPLLTVWAPFEGVVLGQDLAYDFHDGESLGIYHFIDKDGYVFQFWNNEGLLTAGGVTLELDFRHDFHLSSGEPTRAELDEEGYLLSTQYADVDPTAKALVGYVSGGNIMTGSTVLAPLGATTALAVLPGNDKHVRAVVSTPYVHTVAAGDGILIPDDDNELHLLPHTGQSLSVGSNANDTLISTTPVYPDECWMFDGASTMDVRLGVSTHSADTPTLVNGANLTGFQPLIAKAGIGGGSRGETPAEATATRLALRARNLGTRFRSLSFVAGHGGAPYSEIRQGTTVYANFMTAVTRAKEEALMIGKKAVVNAVFVKHGEADISSSSYDTNIAQWQVDLTTDIGAILGQSHQIHLIFAQPSSFQNVPSRSIQFMIEAHISNPYIHVCGPDYGSHVHYASDLLHFESPGYFQTGERFAKAYEQVCWSSLRKAQPLYMTAASRSGGSTVNVSFKVPAPPLVWDTSLVPSVLQRGFTFTDSSGNVPIDSWNITDNGVATGTGTVRLILNRPATGSLETVSIAMTPQDDPRTVPTQPRSNLRDSSTNVSLLDRSTRLYNWAVHQTFTL